MNRNKRIKLILEENQRIIVISDIHGGAKHYEHLIERVALQDTDVLIILGDFIEKGPDNLKMLRLAMNLTKRPNTYVLSGNCESFVYQLITDPNRQEQIKAYVQAVPYETMVVNLYEEAFNVNIKETPVKSELVQARLQQIYSAELNFLDELPWVIDAEPFVFVHGGVSNQSQLVDLDKKTLLSFPAFYNTTHELEQTVVVGHWPIINYFEDSLKCMPIIDPDKRMICIDGGYSVKCHGQVNALVITKKGTDYAYAYYASDDLQEKQCHEETEHHIEEHLRKHDVFKVMWDDNEIEIIKALPEFSWCKKISDGTEGLIKNELIELKEGKYFCNDDYIFKMHHLNKGDKVKYIATYGKYAFVKFKDEYGWVPEIALTNEKL